MGDENRFPRMSVDRLSQVAAESVDPIAAVTTVKWALGNVAHAGLEIDNPAVQEYFHALARQINR